MIPEDRSETAIETGKVFDDLLPLLQTLQPDKLNSTLSAIATALEGRGNALGDNLARADTYFAGLNPHLPTIEADISGLADLATTYGDAAPDLLRFAANSAFTARTTVEKKDVLADFLRGTAGFADTATAFVTENANRLIELPRVSRPTISTFARYSPEFPCLLRGLTDQEPIINETFGGSQGPFLHIRLEPVPSRGAYQPGVDNPRYIRDSGPDCHGLPMPGEPSIIPSQPGDSSGAGSTNPVGTAAEKSAVGAVVGAMTRQAPDEVSDIADLLVGPMLRGMSVVLE